MHPTSFGNSLQEEVTYALGSFFPVIQCLFDPLNKTLNPLSGIWFFLRSGIMWIIWHQRNDLVFNIVKWPLEKTHQVVWGTLLGYSRLE